MNDDQWKTIAREFAWRLLAIKIAVGSGEAVAETATAALGGFDDLYRDYKELVAATHPDRVDL